MNTINNIYVIGLVCIFFMMGSAFTFWLLIVSALIAAIPVATSLFFFLLPIGILIWSFFITSSTVYDSTFAWLCIIYAPFYYTSMLSFVIDGIKSLFD